jgi:hypothetical protein
MQRQPEPGRPRLTEPRIPSPSVPGLRRPSLAKPTRSGRHLPYPAVPSLTGPTMSDLAPHRPGPPTRACRPWHVAPWQDRTSPAHQAPPAQPCATALATPVLPHLGRTTPAPPVAPIRSGPHQNSPVHASPAWPCLNNLDPHHLAAACQPRLTTTDRSGRRAPHPASRARARQNPPNRTPPCQD